MGLLILWWLVLQQPMRVLLRGSVEALGSFVLGIPPGKLVTDAPNGDWTFEVPIEFSATSRKNNSPVHFSSIDFDMPRADISNFTFSLPVYWAIILAAPWSIRTLRVLIQGTLLLAIAETTLFSSLVEISAHNAAAKISRSQNAVEGWLLYLAEYLVIAVLPYVVPFACAVWLHSGLRSQIFGDPRIPIMHNDAAVREKPRAR